MTATNLTSVMKKTIAKKKATEAMMITMNINNANTDACDGKEDGTDSMMVAMTMTPTP